MKLASIVHHHLSVHEPLGFGRDVLLQQLRNCQVSADGVAEALHGSRTFIIVTLKVGRCMYVFHMFNPLIGVKRSMPDPTELMR